MNKLTLYLFDDEKRANLAPLTATHATWDLLFGTGTLREKITRLFPDCLVEGGISTEVISDAPSLPIQPGEYLFVNGRVLAVEELQDIVKGAIPDTGFRNENGLVALRITIKESVVDLQSFLNEASAKATLRPCTVRLGNYLWEYVYANEQAIQTEASFYPLGQHTGKIAERATLINPEQIWIGEGATVAPGAVLDATNGPILMSEDTSIGANAVITGPVFIGKKAQINPLAIIRGGTSLGEGCKVGGEVGSVIMLPYSNKAHFGYLGRSYVGSWCNLGAGSTTSTMKNTYGSIHVTLNAATILTKYESLGAFMGDHVKVGSLISLAPGAVIGCFSNIMGPMPPPREVLPFSWWEGAEQKLLEYKWEKAQEVVDRVLARRKRTATDYYVQQMQALFNRTHTQRDL